MFNQKHPTLYDALPGREKAIGRKLVKKPKTPKYTKGPKLGSSSTSLSRKFKGSPSYNTKPKNMLMRQKGQGMNRYVGVRDAANLAKVLNGDINKVSPTILASAARAAKRLLTVGAVKARKLGRWLTPGYHSKRVRRYKKLYGSAKKTRGAVSTANSGKRLRQARRARNIRYGVGGLAVLGGSRGLADRKKKRVPAETGYYG